jgi:hypothetical protein
MPTGPPRHAGPAYADPHTARGFEGARRGVGDLFGWAASGDINDDEAGRRLVRRKRGVNFSMTS